MNVRPWAPIGARFLLAGWVAAVLGVCATGAPVLAPFPEFVSSEGAAYAGVLHLDDYVEDSTATDADLVWRVAENAALDIQLTRERHLIVRTQHENWCGVAAVTLTVCNPLGECATQIVAFRVEAVPDDPIIDWIPAQVVGGPPPSAPLIFAASDVTLTATRRSRGRCPMRSRLPRRSSMGCCTSRLAIPLGAGRSRSCFRSAIRRVAKLRACCPTP